MGLPLSKERISNRQQQPAVQTGGYLTPSKLTDGKTKNRCASPFVSEEPLEYWTPSGANADGQKKPFRFPYEQLHPHRHQSGDWVSSEPREKIRRLWHRSSRSSASRLFVFDYARPNPVKVLELGPRKRLVKERGLDKISQEEDYRRSPRLGFHNLSREGRQPQH